MLDVNYEDIERKANIIRDSNEFSAFQSIDLNVLYERENINLLETPMDSKISGMFMRQEDKCFVIINSKKSIGHQNFTKAHEYYHFKFDQDLKSKICYAGTFNGQLENELKADLFAAFLLMPKKGIVKVLDDAYSKYGPELTIPTILYLESIFKVSHKSMLRRLNDLNLLEESEKSMLYDLKITKEARTHGYDTDIYLSNNVKRLSPNYRNLIQKRFESGDISENKYLELLNDIKKLGFSEEDIFPDLIESGDEDIDE